LKWIVLLNPADGLGWDGSPLSGLDRACPMLAAVEEPPTAADRSASLAPLPAKKPDNMYHRFALHCGIVCFCRMSVFFIYR
jgi:hypothetical protein